MNIYKCVDRENLVCNIYIYLHSKQKGGRTIGDLSAAPSGCKGFTIEKAKFGPKYGGARAPQIHACR